MNSKKYIFTHEISIIITLICQKSEPVQQKIKLPSPTLNYKLTKVLNFPKLRVFLMSMFIISKFFCFILFLNTTVILIIVIVPNTLKIFITFIMLVTPSRKHSFAHLILPPLSSPPYSVSKFNSIVEYFNSV